MAVCKFDELNCACGEGDMGVCVCLRAPIMHRMSGLSLAWHWHGNC